METRVSDIAYAAFLQTKGYTMARSEKEGRRVFFVFLDIPKEVKDSFFGRSPESCVPALLYADALKSLKTLTHTHA